MQVTYEASGAAVGWYSVILMLAMMAAAQILICYPLLRRMKLSPEQAWAGVAVGMFLAVGLGMATGVNHGHAPAMHTILRLVLLLGVGCAVAVPAFVAIWRAVMGPPQPGSSSAVTADGGAEDTDAARRRILEMVAEKRITAEEGSDLMQAVAVADGMRSPGGAAPLPASQRVLVVGAVLVLVGFLLPWFKFNPNQQIGKLMSVMPGFSEMAAVGMSQISRIYVEVSGGDTRQGWGILLLSVAVAFLPLIPLQITSDTRRFLMLASWCVGAFLLVYVAHNALKFAGVGLALVAAGYVLQGIGLFRDRLRRPVLRMA